MMQYAFLSVYFLAALIVPLAYIGMLWGMYRIASARNAKLFWGWLILILALLPVLTDVRIARTEFVDGVLREAWTPPASVQFLSLWGARGLSYLLVGFSLVMIVKTLLSRHIEKRTGTTLFVAYLAMVTPMFISSILGSNPVFIHFIFFAPLIFMMAYLAQPTADWLWYVKQFKRVLLFYIALSALLGVLFPRWATGTGMVLIPGFSLRLNGIFAHSNGLGMAALSYLVLDMADPARRSIYRKLAWLLSFAVLVTTQSKTAWVGALMAYAILFFHKAHAYLSARTNQSAGPAIVGGLLVFSGLIGLLLAVAGLGGWFRALDNEIYTSLSTLTGRTTIWEITVNTWRQNPIFGYGPSLWDMDYRLKYAPIKFQYTAGMAHNQFFQSLGESGVIGVLGLLVYVSTLLYFGVRFISVTRGVSLALVTVLLVRSVSETPFRNVALDMMFFVHFAVFVLFLSLMVHENNQLEPEDRI
nr:H385 [uncultured bacterium]